ncbi:MAG TPA: acyloxyacyl hydrolase [Terriglobia bacterium]|nr:acyloxyacyl hydrolase [Terriglobia bacterium]
MRSIRPNPCTDLASCLLLAACPLLACFTLQAQTSGARASSAPLIASGSPAYSAHRGIWTFGAQLGYTMEYGLDWHEVSHIQMLIAQPQFGLIVRDLQRSPLRRFEIVNEGILGSAVHPAPAYVLGYALLLRLDGREHGRWMPFLDAGAGVQRTPLSTHVPELNGTTQFSPQAGLGLQYFIRPQRALVVEFRTLHMSNANLVPPNMGFNSGMLTVGFRWWRKPHSF